MQRGEAWWANMPAPSGRRPVILLSRDAVYNSKTSFTVGAVTRTIRNIPSEVKLGQEDGFPVECIVNLDELMTIPKSQLINKITTLSEEKMQAVKRAILYALDLD
jgi:mRNA interferase MazF